MRKLFLLVALTAFSFSLFAQTVWKADPNHSYLGFKVKHMGIATVPGNFNKYNVTITSAKEDFSDAVVEMTAEISSIDTRVEARNNHLKSADFFDAEKYPTMYFKSISIKRDDHNDYKVTGNLTMHGVTKMVTIEMEYNGTTKGGNGGQVAGFDISAKIKRSDFGIGSGFPSGVISDEVKINAYGEFSPKKD